jgi:hypothetical protein
MEEAVVDRTERSEIVLVTSVGFYGRCVAGCPWAGEYRRYKTTAVMDAKMHDDDPQRATWHTAPRG